MELQRRGPAGEEIPVVLDQGRSFDLRPLTADIDGTFLAGDGIAGVRSALVAGELSEIDVTDLRYGAPIARPGAVVCIGQNYVAHAAESGAAPPPEPIIFYKHPNTVVGPFDEVHLPPESKKTDWEVELAVIIGRQARYLASPDEALSYIAGYSISNDVSERTYQSEVSGGQWSKGKCCETFNPLGPSLVPADQLDPTQRPAAVVGQRRAAAGLDHRRHDLLRRAVDLRAEPVPGAGSGRPDQHRHPAGRRAVRPVPLPRRR